MNDDAPVIPYLGSRKGTAFCYNQKSHDALRSTYDCIVSKFFVNKESDFSATLRFSMLLRNILTERLRMIPQLIEIRLNRASHWRF